MTAIAGGTEFFHAFGLKFHSDCLKCYVRFILILIRLFLFDLFIFDFDLFVHFCFDLFVFVDFFFISSY